MRRRPIRWLLIPMIVLQLGCLPTLNPLVTDEDSYFDPLLLGVWIQRGSSTSWSVTHLGDRTYRVVHADDSSRPGQFIGQLAKFGDNLYLDLFPDESVWKENPFERIHSIPIHTIYRLEIKDRELMLHAIDFKKLETYIAEHADKLPSVSWGKRQVITATSSQLQAFVKEQPEIFAHAIELIREY
jgi:hypothetical protein